jgi:hypothetical protein
VQPTSPPIINVITSPLRPTERRKTNKNEAVRFEGSMVANMKTSVFCGVTQFSLVERK